MSTQQPAWGGKSFSRTQTPKICRADLLYSVSASEYWFVWSPVSGAEALATWVAAKAMNRNMKVPTNSSRNVIILLRTQFGMKAEALDGFAFFAANERCEKRKRSNSR